MIWFVLFIVVVIGVIAVVLSLSEAARKEKYARFLAKYGDTELVERLMNKTV